MTDTDIQTRTSSISRFASPARLLVLALFPLALFLIVASMTVEGSTSATMTPDQVRDRAVSWILMSILWVAPIMLAGIAFSAIDRSLGHTAAVRSLAGLGLALLASYVVATAAMIATVETLSLADSRLYAATIVLSLLGWWAVDLVAVVSCVRLFRAKIATRAAVAIGVLTALLVLFELAVYLPALVGSQALHEVVALPPMALPMLWAVLGGFLWRVKLVSSGRSGSPRRAPSR